MKNFSFLILMFVFFKIAAQDNVLKNNVSSNYIQLRDELKSRETSQSQIADVEGSPYWEEEFKAGKIETEKIKNVEVFLRYNVRKEQIEIKSDLGDDETFILPRNTQIQYNLMDYSYQYGTVQTKSAKFVRGYLMHIFSSDAIKFMSKIRAEIEPGKVAETSYDRSQPPRLNLRQDYYISVNGDLYEEVRLKEKDFRRIFKSENMKTYFKNHKVKDKEDIVAMLEFYSNNES